MGDIYYYCTSSCRLVLRCRQLAREKFARLRSDVLVKMELLDNKHGKTEIIKDYSNNMSQ